MSSLTLDRPADASSAVNWASQAIIAHVAGVSPVNCMVSRRSDHGPTGLLLSSLPSSEPPIRANEKPRSPLLVESSTYACLIRLSGPTWMSEAVDAPHDVQ